ncbi:MAG: acylneuraminate cytidylyltransferase family protein [Lentisphaeria bacterium]|nr:acylneuraminate cytidylyltransferase family protein [Lentisphaeria bacterium]
MDRKPVIHAWIFARGGSKGLPGKNIRPLRGKPLIAYAIETAQKSRLIKDVFVSTDSPDIAAVAEQYGAIVPFLRPAELASDTANERMAWRHAIEWMRSQDQFAPMDIMVSLPTTAPLRTPDEVDEAIELYLKGEADTVIAVSKSARHPAFNMVYVDKDKYAKVILGQYEEWVPNRQAYPPAYDITTAVYVSGADYIMEQDSYLKGRVQAIVIPEDHGIDIDTLLDFQQAELLLAERVKR